MGRHSSSEIDQGRLPSIVIVEGPASFTGQCVARVFDFLGHPGASSFMKWSVCTGKADLRSS